MTTDALIKFLHAFAGAFSGDMTKSESKYMCQAADELDLLATRVRELEDAVCFAVRWLKSCNVPPQVTDTERDEVLRVLHRALIKRGKRDEAAEKVAKELADKAAAILRAALEPGSSDQ